MKVVLESFLVSDAGIGSHLDQVTEQVYCKADGLDCQLRCCGTLVAVIPILKHTSCCFPLVYASSILSVHFCCALMRHR
jgi:hypothetical protein